MRNTLLWFGLHCDILSPSGVCQAGSEQNQEVAGLLKIPVGQGESIPKRKKCASVQNRKKPAGHRTKYDSSTLLCDSTGSKLIVEIEIFVS